MPLSNFGVFLATPADFIRLVALPIFAWIAWKDIKTRRVSNQVWLPLIALGAVLLAWDAWNAWGTLDWTFFIAPVGVSLFVVIPGAYLMWWIGGFGGADAKAIMTLAILFPTYPTYFVGSDAYPVVESTIGSFSFTILANAVIVALIAPFGLLTWNIIRGDRSPVMFLGRILPVSKVTETPGKILESENGFTRSGLDLDVLRMYLRWRGTSLTEIRADPAAYRHPETLPETTHETTDGAVYTDGGQVTSTGAGTTVSVDQPIEIPEENDGSAVDDDSSEPLDWWGAEAFLDDAPHAYGVTANEINQGLEVLVQQDDVWVSPGTPFMLPIFVGMTIALVYGNILFSLMYVFGLA